MGLHSGRESSLGVINDRIPLTEAAGTPSGPAPGVGAFTCVLSLPAVQGGRACGRELPTAPQAAGMSPPPLRSATASSGHWLHCLWNLMLLGAEAGLSIASDLMFLGSHRENSGSLRTQEGKELGRGGRRGRAGDADCTPHSSSESSQPPEDGPDPAAILILCPLLPAFQCPVTSCSPTQHPCLGHAGPCWDTALSGREKSSLRG